jgi:carbonic anhydrase
MQYACNVAGSKLIVVLGHNKCAAITSACNNYRMGHFTGLLDKLKPAIDNEASVLSDRNGRNAEFINKVSINNVLYTIKQIRDKSNILYDLESIKKIRITGAFYNVDTGSVKFMPEL